MIKLCVMLCVGLLFYPKQSLGVPVEVTTLTSYFSAIIKGELDIVLTTDLSITDFHAQLTPDTLRVHKDLMITGLIHGNPSAYPVLDHEW